MIQNEAPNLKVQMAEAEVAEVANKEGATLRSVQGFTMTVPGDSGCLSALSMTHASQEQ
jgi:hypothetical protein